MNVYDKAHQLAKALKESIEYKSFKELQKKLEENPEIKEMMEDFKKHRFEVQSAQMRGQQVEADKLTKLEELQRHIMEEAIVAEYIEAEYRFTQMVTDIYKIIGESIEVDIKG
ncbi:YlbF family regulator [Alkaliphilus hydrothermalis]|uniref:Cell fate (Sporulation/competence/biofilm development) regulator YlbF (YheA/YmcA/DUF963 family) n=1 Tax=Alkaliphilus hydrothermalis TaxID=1482730 RepID=A0ABS2NM11_9FIRM|nr:YlbF family regulator [Alkaliphilus hydrothermalis]MBM7613963.1 cell fate (sporulation/competence/biofilm development) regulator YlbF (YheA/YmcA/DUF963 family) [Alkaliphilus hydrothermalis]